MKKISIIILYFVSSLMFSGCESIQNWIAEDKMQQYENKISNLYRKNSYMIRENRQLKLKIKTLTDEITLRDKDLEDVKKQNQYLKQKFEIKQNNLKQMFN